MLEQRFVIGDRIASIPAIMSSAATSVCPLGTFGPALIDLRRSKRRGNEARCSMSTLSDHLGIDPEQMICGLLGSVTFFPSPAPMKGDRIKYFACHVEVRIRPPTLLGHRGDGGRRLLPRSKSRAVRNSVKSEPQVLETWSMNDTYDSLAQRLWTASKMNIGSDRYVVGLAGPPGAGKTTVAREVVARVNALWREEVSVESDAESVAVAVPMDGFHLYRKQLDAMQDPTEAHARRGAPWTFDAVGLLKSLSKLRKQGPVLLPSFDHGVGDPVEDDIRVEDWHRVVLVEGNYVLLTDGAWKDVGEIFDEKWFVAVDLDEAMDRVEKRHVITGKPPEVAKWRVAYNDRPNAEVIQASRSNADLVIRSVPL